MRLRSLTMALLCGGVTFLTVSCENDMEEMDMKAMSSQNAVATTAVKLDTLITLKNPEELGLISENLRNYFVVNNLVQKTECGPTDFATVQNKYIGQLGQELIPAFGGDVKYVNYLFGLYMDINFISAYVDKSGDQYFGEKGEYTNFMAKRKRELEGFWSMPGQIRVNGQHGATLNDRERVAYVLYNYFNGIPSMQFAYQYADMLLEYNAVLSTLPESPFFSVDGFATNGNTIVIGDGLVKMAAEAGNVSQDIVWTGILAHEWAHQIQFDNFNAWYPNGAADNVPEATRYTELEADFLAAYYMTHKRGATYNSKRVAQFYELFFQIGDCGFTSDGHHGTPLQRMAAAELGFNLAASAQKQGHIMTAQEAHEYFVARIDNILATTGVAAVQ